VRAAINWFAIGFKSAEATNARLILCTATWLSLRERARDVARLRFVAFAFGAALFAPDLALVFFLAELFLVFVVLVDALDE
jgi:hypothetical protein